MLTANGFKPFKSHEFPETPREQDIFHNSEWETDKRRHIVTFAGTRPV
jgi:hypothetical protein